MPCSTAHCGSTDTANPATTAARRPLILSLTVVMRQGRPISSSASSAMLREIEPIGSSASGSASNDSGWLRKEETQTSGCWPTKRPPSKFGSRVD